MLKWKWNKSVDEFLQQWFVLESNIDQRLINTIKDLKKNNYNCYLASDQEKYRAKYLYTNLGLNKYFIGAFFSCDLGCRKINPEFFKIIIKRLNIGTDKIYYWDDDINNIQVAKKMGINGYEFLLE